MANLYNGERYIDPTAYQALTNIERKERSDRRKAKRKANREAKKLLKPEPIYRPVVYMRQQQHSEGVPRICVPSSFGATLSGSCHTVRYRSPRVLRTHGY